MSGETKLLVLDIRDIDSIATEQEICAAIASQYGIDAERIRVRSLRRGYVESQSAVISLPYFLGSSFIVAMCGLDRPSALRQERRRPGTRQEADSDLDRIAVDPDDREPPQGRAGPPEADGAKTVL